MPKAIFTRKPVDLNQVIIDTAEIESVFHSKGQEYYVAEERELSEIEWRRFVARLLDDQPWIEAFSKRDLPCTGPEPCIRVTSPCAKIALIVDPQGYSYARYVAIETEAEAEQLSNREEEEETMNQDYENYEEENEAITEDEVVDGLRALLMGDDLDCTGMDNCLSTQTYEDGGYMTYDKGFVVRMADGSVFQVTVKQER